jgi:murein DD-endopeptidase MepM/ murein hydrolase activator NlpD
LHSPLRIAGRDVQRGLRSIAILAAAGLVLATPISQRSLEGDRLASPPGPLMLAQFTPGDIGNADGARQLVSREVKLSRSSGRTLPTTRADDPAPHKHDRSPSRQRAGGEPSTVAAHWTLPVVGYELTGRFGEVSSLWSASHTGLDFAAPGGTPIRAVASGEVVSAAWDGSYGYLTVVRLPDGTEIWYAHQQSIAADVGSTVQTGDIIGSVGATGNVTGEHLHLEIRPGGGDPVDPLGALAAKGLRP